jgi:hypothetical protein
MKAGGSARGLLVLMLLGVAWSGPRLWEARAAGLRGTLPAAPLVHIWSGIWHTQFGDVGFRFVDQAEGIGASSQYGPEKLTCASDAEYYRGGYNYAGGGKELGCSTGDPNHLLGRYLDNQAPHASGSFDIHIVQRAPLAFDGTFTPDHGTSADWHATFRKHFDGDNCCGLRIQDTPEYRTFLGLDDPAKTDYPTWLKAMLQGFIDHTLHFPGATSTSVIPGETVLGVHSDHYLYPNNDLFNLLGLSTLPHTLASAGNVYAQATLPYEPRVQAAILSSGGNLLPGDVVEMAMTATSGSYPLAVLTLHNLLKEEAISGRKIIAEATTAYATDPVAYAAKYQDLIARLQQQDRILAKLQNLRRMPNSPQARDKIGPWYHAFAVLAIGGLAGASDAKAIAGMEHSMKYIHGFQNEGGFNREKFNLDFCWSIVAGQVQHLDRAYLIAIVPSPMSLCYKVAS